MRIRLPRLRHAFLPAFLALAIVAGNGGDLSARAVEYIAPAGYDAAAIATTTSVEDLTARSDLIVVGRVAGINPFAGNNRGAATEVRITTETVLKGAHQASFTVKLPGGIDDGKQALVGGVPAFIGGERVLLFLTEDGGLHLTQLWQSKFSLAGSAAYQPEAHSQVAISTLEAKIGGVLDQPVVIGSTQNEGVVAQPFTTTCSPWPDDALPVSFYVNPNGSGASAATAARISYQSWNAWQALSDSYPAFHYAGVTGAYPLDGDGDAVSDGLDSVAWGDLDVIGTGVLGINYCWFGGGERVESDTIIDTTGFTWDWDDSNGITAGQFSLQAVMEHELGHGLSLGHSNVTCNGGASTPLMCPAISAGVRKTIKADDQAGAASMYGLTGAAPGAPSGLSWTAGASSNSLSWLAASGSVIGYDIQRASGCGGSFRSIQTVPAGTTAYVDNDYGGGLAGPGSYCYRVRAIGRGGDSAYATQAPVYGVTWGSHTMPASIEAGTTSNPAVTFTNTGTLSWQAGGGNPVRFSYHWRNGACPGGSTAVYDGVRTNLPGNVTTGSTVNDLPVLIQAPVAAGSYCLVFDLVREGVTWFSSQGANTLNIPVTITTGQYGANWTADTTPSSMTTGATVATSVSVTNTGSLTWSPANPNPVRVSYHWRNGACPGTSSAVFDGLRTVLPGEVANGESLSNLSMQVRAPNTAGTYCLQYDLVREGVTWFSSQGVAMRQRTVTVTAPTYGVLWTGDSTPSSAVTGMTFEATVSFTNTGSLTWSPANPNPVRASYHWRNGACPGTSSAVFDGQRTVLAGDVGPGESVNNMTVQIRAPQSAGTYCLVYDFVREGVTWFSWQGAATRTRTVTVAGDPVYFVTWDDDSVPGSMTAGEATDVDLSFTNAGTLTWPDGGSNPVRVAYHWLNGSCPGGSTAVWDGVRTVLPQEIDMDESVVDLTASVTAPATPGSYCLVIDLVHEGITWFGNQGSPTLKRSVTVVAP
jgi:hypothetical protein